MLTRFVISGFKNLIDVDVRFGPFTCIAGANGVGKSNLFDAIRFLSMTADRPLIDAAQSIRDEAGRRGDIRSIFHRVGDHITRNIRLSAEMIVPAQSEDDLGQIAIASARFLVYKLELAYRTDENGAPGIEIVHEELIAGSNKSNFARRLPFLPPRSGKKWRESVWKDMQRNNAPFISTSEIEGERRINQHQDGGSAGKPFPRLASRMPRTVLSVMTAAESPTSVVVRQEMRAWRMLQFEPSALRRTDEFGDAMQIDFNGSHLASTLYRLANRPGADPDQVYSKISNHAIDLLREFKSVWVDRDEKRETYTLMLRDANGTSHPAHAMSDGTLRFLALAIMSIDPLTEGVLCLEEPENGLHPGRIPDMYRLLRSIAVDTDFEVDDDDNPLRQVIINTHSSVLVQEIEQDDLLVARLVDARTDSGEPYQYVCFFPLEKTWRIVIYMEQNDTFKSLHQLPAFNQLAADIDSHLPMLPHPESDPTPL